MTAHPEQPIDPPGAGISDAEQRELDARARRGFDAMDERMREWLLAELADTPIELCELARGAILRNLGRDSKSAYIGDCMSALRDRYIAECAGDYADDARAEAESSMEDQR